MEEEALSDSQEQHASAVEALQSEAEQLKQGHAEQIETIQSEHAAAQAKLIEEHASAIATVEAELTDKLNAESAAHAETKKRLEAWMAAAPTEQEAAVAAQREELLALR
eukprot:SAG25_NODE_9015_length_392_cov_0.757679_1_plen_108_part_10